MNRHPWRAIAMWVVVVIACFALGSVTGTKESKNEGDIGEVTRADNIVKSGNFDDPVQATNSAPAPMAPEFKGINHWINSDPVPRPANAAIPAPRSGRRPPPPARSGGTC